MEQWKPIKDFEGWYEISNTGKIRSITRTIEHNVYKENAKRKTQIAKGRELTIKYNNMGKGYAYVQLYKHSKHYKRFVHRLVAQAFIKNVENKAEVNHKDGNPRNNNVENLEWVTKEENMKHALEEGLYTTEKRVRSTNLNTGEIKEYRSIAQASKDIGASHSGIVQNLKGKIKSFKNCVWEYI